MNGGTATSGAWYVRAADPGTAIISTSGSSYNGPTSVSTWDRYRDDLSITYTCRPEREAEEEDLFTPPLPVMDRNTSRTAPTLARHAKEKFDVLILCPMIRAPAKDRGI